MGKVKLNKNSFKTMAGYCGAVILCLIVLTCSLKLWEADFKVPFVYDGDGLFNGMVIKGIINNGWYLHNSFIGMPLGLNLNDFPMADNFHFFIMKLISLFTLDWGITLNLYFLLTFPLTTLAALFVFRHFKISWGPSIVGSLLFAFLPYHFSRGESHLFLAAYYMIPLMTMVILWTASDEGLFFKKEERTNKLRLDLLNFKSIASILICILVASTGVYYAFFACFFLIIAGVCRCFSSRHIFNLLISGILIAVISTGLIINLSPSLIYNYEKGKNQEAAQRGIGESEIYGMKITQLLLPVSGHRVPILAKIKAKYNNSAQLVNENDSATLGMVGSLGFIILIAMLFYRKQSMETNDTNNQLCYLSYLNISAVLLATIGGFGSIFALLVSPQIRGYNRISIYIAFFSIFTVSLLLDKIYKKYIKSSIKKIFYYALLLLILTIGIFDQTSKGFIPLYEWYSSEYYNDAKFVKQIENIMPEKSMIFQLPYISFPGIDDPSRIRVGEYGLFRGYLHSNNLRWSFGTIKGREGDLWYKHVASKLPEELVKTLSVSGFAGIYIDRNGYEDMGAELENKLSEILDTKPIVSQNSKLVFFDMTNYNREFKSKSTEKDWMLLKEKVLYPMFLTWGKGFYGFEGAQDNNWRWCSSKGELVINNLSNEEKKIKMKMSFGTGYSELSNLKIESELFSENFKISSKINPFSKEVIIKPGRHVIKFSSDAKTVNAPLDPRILNFVLYNFEIIELNSRNNQEIIIKN